MTKTTLRCLGSHATTIPEMTPRTREDVTISDPKKAGTKLAWQGLVGHAKAH
jgi:hypothetical protein